MGESDFPTQEIGMREEKPTALGAKPRAVLGGLVALAPRVVEIDEASERDGQVVPERGRRGEIALGVEENRLRFRVAALRQHGGAEQALRSADAPVVVGERAAPARDD